MTHRPSQNNETTRRPLSQQGQAETSAVMVLTVLSHPDPLRVGERAALMDWAPSRTVELGRHSPRFSPVGSPWNDRPLDDPYLSRKPWAMTMGDQGLELVRGNSSMELRLDGAVVDDVTFVAEERLALGVTLELSGCIALLLHRMPESSFTAAESEPPTGEMVGASAGVMAVRSAVDRVADLDVPVLVRGESGTGKELVARALHRQSLRASQPFVAVDLGVLSPALAASELFGHAKGAFTGADSAREGFFRVADGGTLFLDEVGEATDEVQAMLLRVLETRQVVAVGSQRPIAVDVRLIAATDSDLVARARRGDFKEPLLHRLAAYVVELPPLRQRREDIGRLFLHLARPVLRELGEEDRLQRPSRDGSPWLPAGLMARLARETWTGNIRQLANVVRQLVIDSRGEGRLRAGASFWARLETESPASSASSGSPEHALEALPAPTPEKHIDDRDSEAVDNPSARDAAALDGHRIRRPSELTDDEVLEAMEACNFEPAAAARRLGIRRPSLYKRVRRHPTLRLAADIPPEELVTALAQVDGSVVDAAHVLAVSKRALGRRLTDLGLRDEGTSPERPEPEASP